MPSAQTNSSLAVVNSAAHVPSTRPEIIQSLIDGVDRYNPDNISILEEYLATQCQNDEYDLMANLAILKLYQFNPHLINDQIINNILIKAITAVPEPDFNLCCHLLTELNFSEPSLQRLVNLNTLLSSAKYEQFWEAYRSDREFDEQMSDVRNFDVAARRGILRMINMTYQTISTDRLASFLGLDTEATVKFISQFGWTEKDGVVQIPLNKDNDAKTVVIRENIKFDQLTKVISHSNEM